MSEFIYKLDYTPDPPDPRDYIYSNSPGFTYEAPSVVDWASTMTPIKDQGRLGSCVGFAVTAMKEWQEIQQLMGKKYSVRNQDCQNLSEAWVYWITKKSDPWPGQEGTSIRYAMKTLQGYGVTPERFWIYTDAQTETGSPKGMAAIRYALQYRIGSYWNITNLAEFYAALKVQPIPIGIYCFSEMMSVGKNGIIPMPANPNNPIGGHAICAVGYDDSKQLVKFKNSWGMAWGQNGYGYLSYDYIYNFMLDAWTCTDLPEQNIRGNRTANIESILEKLKN